MIGIMNSSRQVIAKYRYDAWGKLISMTDASGAALGENTIGARNPLRYRGYIYDSETGFYYLQSRYYDPVVHRFINADGYVSTGTGFNGYNMYAYCNNDPVMSYDPSGYVVTDWYRAHLSSSDLRVLETLTYLWHNSDDEEIRANAHSKAVKIRSVYKADGDYVNDCGYIVRDGRILSSFRHNLYVFDYTIEKHAFHIDVEQWGFAVLCASFENIDALSISMLNCYRSIYGVDFIGRTVGGITREIYAHAVCAGLLKDAKWDWVHEIFSHAKYADIEDTQHGSTTWRLFEFIWDW